MGELSKTTINGVSYDLKDAGAARQSHSHTKSQITDFPTLGTAASKNVPSSGNASTSQVVMGNDSRLSDARTPTSHTHTKSQITDFPTSMPASDVYSWAKQSSKPSYTASEVGAIATSAKGAANGVASLDSAGKVPSSQLPSYVDDVLEYSAKSSFPATGETGKIYVDTSNNKTYRWSGSAYVEISASLALGETSSTAYAGDKGKTAYSHATDSSRLTTAQSSGLYKIATTAQGHIASVTAVAKSDITNLGIPGRDTNTHRPIQMNGSQILGDNTTALNLKAGSNVSLSNSSGTVTIAATNTTYSAATTSTSGLMSATDKTAFNAHLNNPNKNLVSDPHILIGSSGTSEVTPFNPNLQAGTYVITCKYTSSATAQFKLYYADGTEENLGNTVPIGTNATFTAEFSISKPVKLLKIYTNGTFISSYGNFMVCSKTDWTIDNSIVVPCSRILCMDDSFVLNDLIWHPGSQGQYYTDDLTTNITQSISGVMAVTIKDMLFCRTTDVLVPNARYGGKIGFLSNTNSFVTGATVLVRVCGWL